MLKIAFNFLSISLNMCFGCSKELSHRDGSFGYPQHMFWLRNKNNNFQLHTLTLGPVTTFISYKIHHSGSVGRVLDLGSKGCWFETYWCHCVMSEQGTLSAA